MSLDSTQQANSASGTTLWDVVAVNIKSGEHRVMEAGKTHANAEAIMNMAIARRGLDVKAP